MEKSNGCESAKAKKKPTLPSITPNFELFAEYLNTYFSAVDEHGRIHYINSAFAKALGYRQKEMMGRHAFEFIMEYNSDGVFQWDRIEEVLNNPGNVPIRAMELRCKNGDTIWVELRETLYKLSNSGLRISMATNIDITANKRSQAEKKQLYDFHLTSAFMNNSVRSRFQFVDVFLFLQSIGITINLPVVAIFFKTANSTPCSADNTEVLIKWKRWAIPIINCTAAEYQHVVWETPQGLVLLLCLAPIGDAKEQLDKVITMLIDQLSAIEVLTKTILGVSSVWNQPGIVSTLVAEAEESVHWGRVMDPGKNCYHWNSLGIGQLLLSLNKEQAKQFFKLRLAPVLDLPDINQDELLQTLCEILLSGSVNASANRLHVHPKTIAYRRTRLEKLLNVDFDNPTARAELFIAFRLYQHYREEETRLL